MKELKGKIILIKYVRQLTNLSLVEAKEIVDAYCIILGLYSDSIFLPADLVNLSLFVGKITSNNWTLKDNRVYREELVDEEDVKNLSYDF